MSYNHNNTASIHNNTCIHNNASELFFVFVAAYLCWSKGVGEILKFLNRGAVRSGKRESE